MVLALCCQSFDMLSYPGQKYMDLTTGLLLSKNRLSAITLSSVLGLTVPACLELLHAIYSEEPSPALDRAAGSSLIVHDLDIKSLTSFGGLNVVPTSNIEHHLQPNSANKTLQVAWTSTNPWFDIPTGLEQWQSRYYTITS